MDAKELIRLLEKQGWEEVRTRGSHRMFKHPDSDRTIPIAFHGHRDIPIGTLRKILKQAGRK
ncbi:type II toxin-antitoxin system HicA family toxin [Dyadobacter sp. CY347]|uniref:type II toxin-antitoxin system HicA family toxin n=1 Tax=Dyadobacter sp. CY347 TaxID=2909336 RepID=UPI001F1DCF30|nr:type II toxin-antitoxin system HicA family toxin [Dyadobacter sp. CY347]MCF2486972.1 type II toxin-antitoxin system HicA family toxin [Dyadobacter sp. CY347]